MSYLKHKPGSIEELMANEIRLKTLLSEAKSVQSPSKELITKYENALKINNQKLILAESKKQLELKKASQH